MGEVIKTNKEEFGVKKKSLGVKKMTKKDKNSKKVSFKRPTSFKKTPPATCYNCYNDTESDK